MFSLDKNYIKEQKIIINSLRQEIQQKDELIAQLQILSDAASLEESDDLLEENLVDVSSVKEELDDIELDDLSDDISLTESRDISDEEDTSEIDTASLEEFDDLLEEELTDESSPNKTSADQIDDMFEEELALDVNVEGEELPDSDTDEESKPQQFSDKISLADIEIPEVYEMALSKKLLAHLDIINPNNYYRGKRKFVTLLLIKIDEATLQTQLSPVAYVKLYNKLLNQTSTSVYNNNGIINQFAGTYFLAVFGLFDTHNSAAAKNALKSAQEINHKIQAINQYLQEKDLNSITSGMGLHSGEVVLGKVGATDTKDILIMGDAVKVAESLSEVSKKQKIKAIFTDVTENLLPANHPLSELGTLVLPGLRQKIKSFKL